MQCFLDSRVLASWTAWRERLLETLQKNGHLGFVCFGGPPVHFQIVSISRGLKFSFSIVVA
jgi:hypothetical protein